MTFDVVIFDWDGTLVDSVDHIAGSLEQAARDLQLPVRSREQLRHIVGLGMHEALEHLYPGITANEVTTLRECYAGYFFSRDTTPEDLFPGTESVLAGLKQLNRRMAVATGKSRPGLDRGLDSSRLGSYFEVTRCANETASKPDPMMLREILEATGTHPERAIMVGDTIYDMEMAQRIGMPAVGVTWGVHSPEQLREHQPFEIVSDRKALQEILLSRQ